MADYLYAPGEKIGFAGCELFALRSCVELEDGESIYKTMEAIAYLLYYAEVPSTAKH